MSSVSPARLLFAALAFAGLLAGCAKPPQDEAVLTTQALPSEDVGAVAHQAMPAALGPPSELPTILDAKTLTTLRDPDIVTGSIEGLGIAGRTLYVSSVADFAKLRKGEVILTFDDGPHPTITPKILKTLKAYGVKATFFMVGKMARAHAETAQLVAKAGHTIGSHTHNHENLSAVTYEAALTSITKSEIEISAALKPGGYKLSPFFRFPYLMETRALKADLADSDITVFGVDIDSWDYLSQSTDKVLKRTLRRLDEKGKGIVLFHDIHARTAKLLPDFLDALQEHGYTVVRAVPKSRSLFDMINIAALR